MKDITEFLTARYDEDEAVARTAAWMDSPYPNTEPSAEWTYAGEEVEPGVTRDYEGLSPAVDEEQGPHIARHDPARVLAEVAAKRAIMADHERSNNWGDICTRCFKEHGWPESMWEDTMHEWPCPTIRLLAQPYAEHPDFDQAWRVA